ncbi:hypothetical protein [Sphingomonas sp. VDB2]|uniref:hypothetical protein n=1 Tax=Sphingomonas sp. VDB2 TaxID=3228751 RepID=UPI003A7FE5BA
MPITRSDMPEDEQWSAAARMLEVHGDDVGNVLIERVRSLMDAHEHQEAKTWLDICSKVQRLYGGEGGA